MKYKDQVVYVNTDSEMFGKLFYYLCPDPMHEGVVSYIQDRKGCIELVFDKFIITVGEFQDKCQEILKDCKIGFLPCADEKGIRWSDTDFSFADFNAQTESFYIICQNGFCVDVYSTHYDVWVKDKQNETELFEYLKEKFV